MRAITALYSQYTYRVRLVKGLCCGKALVAAPASQALGITCAHVLTWRKDLEGQELSGTTIRRKRAALSSLFEHLCDVNAVTHNPVKGVKRPKVKNNTGGTVEGAVTAGGIYKMVKHYAERVGVNIEGFGAHSLRATAATTLLHGLN